jgi:ADP-dependent NAD(P)H-hydrate dehydratase / NAD(P)H-hydrate epimerase
MAFLKAGGGISCLATPKSKVPPVGGVGCELVYVPMAEAEDGGLLLENQDLLLEFMAESDMVVVGSGLYINQESQKLIKVLAEKTTKPLLLDAAAFEALSEHLDILKARKAPTILTPDLGELDQLVWHKTEEIQRKKIEVLQDGAKAFNSIIVMKGAHTLIGYPDGKVYVNLSGSPALAKAGSGDILAGTIAAMSCSGLQIEDAVRIGVFVHGYAGYLLGSAIGESGVVAGDILAALPKAVRLYREKFEQVKQKHSLPLA